MEEIDQLEQLDTVTERPLISVTSGCLYAFFVVGLSATLLFLNALACLAAYPYFPSVGDEQIGAKLGQLFFFMVPLIMLIVEWHLIDRLQRMFRSNKT